MNKEILKEEKAPSVEKKFTDAQNKVLKHIILQIKKIIHKLIMIILLKNF